MLVPRVVRLLVRVEVGVVVVECCLKREEEGREEGRKVLYLPLTVEMWRGQGS